MSPLLMIRAQRDQMSAIDRRIADFLLENAHLLRDYSSPQLADALGISQSSVVKFSQRLGFRGYPDLKYSIGDALARGGMEPEVPPPASPASAAHAELSTALWRRKAEAEQETRLINPDAQLDAAVAALTAASSVFVAGLGEDGVAARAFASRLALLGLPARFHADPVLLAAPLAAARRGDVLVAFCERGRQHDLCLLARDFRERRGLLVSVTRHSANPLRAAADLPLLVSAHAEEAHVEPLLYAAALQQLMDLLFLLLHEAVPACRELLAANLEQRRRLVDP
jgi:DNA-binding MurR/RpiR family transcriptional regulator